MLSPGTWGSLEWGSRALIDTGKSSCIWLDFVPCLAYPRNALNAVRCSGKVSFQYQCFAFMLAYLLQTYTIYFNEKCFPVHKPRSVEKKNQISNKITGAENKSSVS